MQHAPAVLAGQVRAARHAAPRGAGPAAQPRAPACRPPLGVHDAALAPLEGDLLRQGLLLGHLAAAAADGRGGDDEEELEAAAAQAQVRGLSAAGADAASCTAGAAGPALGRAHGNLRPCAPSSVAPARSWRQTAPACACCKSCWLRTAWRARGRWQGACTAWQRWRAPSSWPRITGREGGTRAAEPLLPHAGSPLHLKQHVAAQRRGNPHRTAPPTCCRHRCAPRAAALVDRISAFIDQRMTLEAEAAVELDEDDGRGLRFGGRYRDSGEADAEGGARVRSTRNLGGRGGGASPPKSGAVPARLPCAPLEGQRSPHGPASSCAPRVR